MMAGYFKTHCMNGQKRLSRALQWYMYRLSTMHLRSVATLQSPMAMVDSQLTIVRSSTLCYKTHIDQRITSKPDVLVDEDLLTVYLLILGLEFFRKTFSVVPLAFSYTHVHIQNVGS